MTARQGPTIERMFLGLADRTRLRLLNLMGTQEVCVCYFVEALRLPQPTVSRHLAYLRRTGLVHARREGKWIHYRIAIPENPLARQVLLDAMRWLAEDREMQRDLAVLQGACCNPKRFERLLAAPLPSTPAKSVGRERP
jgi:ArsR family transcriptional regulator